MHLSNVLPAANFQVCGGSEFLWNCYGPNARYLDFSDKNQNERAACVFDTRTQEVYEIDIGLEEQNTGYKWYNPKYFNKMLEDSKQHQVDYMDAWDDVKWTIIANDDEMLTKLTKALTT